MRTGSAVARRLAGSAIISLSLLTSHIPRLTAQAPTSLTIYNDGRVLVRRLLPLEVPRGESSQRLTLGALDLATLFSTDSTVELTGAAYDGATDYASVLRRAVGRRLLFRNGKDTLSATLLGVNPERYKLPDGSISFSPPGVPQFPEDLVVIDPVVTLGLKSAAARKSLALGWFTSGAQWQASYQVILGAATAQVSGSAIIEAGALTARDAEVQLLAGSVSRAEPKREELRLQGMVMARAAEMDQVSVSEQKVGEFHLYSLPGRTTLLPGISQAVELFSPAQVKYTKTFEVRGQIPYWGGLPQMGDEAELPVMVTYTLQRPRKTEFGDRPLAGGVARLFQADSGGRLQLVGESALDHTPAGEDLRLGAGQAFDLTAKRVQTTYKSGRDSVGVGYWRSWATADYTVTLQNAGAAAVTIDVLETRGGEWSVLSSSVKPEKVSSTITRFRMAVPAAGKAVLKYRVRVVW